MLRPLFTSEGPYDEGHTILGLILGWKPQMAAAEAIM